MTRLLHLDASARPHGSDTHAHGSHTRRLSARFVRAWQALRPRDPVSYRDVGMSPPAPVSGAWIHAAFTPPAAREPWMHETLAESDALIDELIAADVIAVGLPMYNFNVPAQFKAYVDNVVRVGRTFGFDRSRGAEPYWPLLADAGKTLVLLGSRGDYGYDGERLGHLNHGEASVRTAFGYLGIVDAHGVAIEYDEFADARLAASIAQAEARVDALVGELVAARELREAA